MNKRQVIILWVIAIALGAAVTAVKVSQNQSTRSATKRSQGQTLFESFPANDAASIEIQGAAGSVTLAADTVRLTGGTIATNAEAADGGPWFAAGPGTARPIDDWIKTDTWSNHPSGGNVLLADGSVRFVSANISIRTLAAFVTRNGGETVSAE